MDFVILEVLRELQKRDDGHQYDVYVAPGPDLCLQTEGNLRVIELRCPTYPLWEQVALPRAVKHSDACLLHCTSNTAPLYSPVPLMITLHDIIYLRNKRPQGMSSYQRLGWCYRRWNVPRILSKCKRVITVSQTERQNILGYFPQLEQSVDVIPNGYSSCYRPLSMEQTDPIIQRYTQAPFFLFLGNTDPRKNTLGVLQAYSSYLEQSTRKCQLIISGLTQEQIRFLLKQKQITHCLPHLICPGYIPSPDLPALYNRADAFLFPSFQEGFGIPILEAMACGTPVITSRTSAMPEVAGAVGLLVDPGQPQEIARALLRLETDEPFRQQQIAYGLERVKQFSWKNTAKHYIQLYESIFQTTPY